MTDAAADAPLAHARYSAVAVTLHWLMAVLLFMQIMGGWTMTDDATPRAQAFQMFQMHKSFGFTILALSFVRLAWRIMNPPPPPPADMPGWQKMVAEWTHFGFYALMIGIPLSGWIMISTAPYTVTTMWFGLFEIPKINALAGLDAAAKKVWNEAGNSAHSALVWGTIGLWALHVGAALKHHFMDRDDVLTRMIPFLKPLKRS